MLKKFDKADKYFEMALKINCDDTVACVNKARNYLKNNEIMATHPLIRRLKEVRYLTILFNVKISVKQSVAIPPNSCVDLRDLQSRKQRRTN